MLDDHNIDTTVREAAIFELCERLQPGIVQDVVIPYSMTDWGGCIIQVKKRNQIDEGWQRNFMGAVLSCSQGMRLAIAVSEDVDPYSMDDVMWCLTTRVNPQTDILNPIPGGRGQTFMPAERMTAGGAQWTASNTRFEGGMGIDATVPFGYENDFLRPVYPVDKVKTRGLLHQEGHRERQVAHGRLGEFAGAQRAVAGSKLVGCRVGKGARRHARAHSAMAGTLSLCPPYILQARTVAKFGLGICSAVHPRIFRPVSGNPAGMDATRWPNRLRQERPVCR